MSEGPPKPQPETVTGWRKAVENFRNLNPFKNFNRQAGIDMMGLADHKNPDIAAAAKKTLDTASEQITGKPTPPGE